MLDGQVLGASQVEYKPFGKPPPKRELRRCATRLLRGRTTSRVVRRSATGVVYRPAPGNFNSWYTSSTTRTSCALSLADLPLTNLATSTRENCLSRRATCPALKPRQAAEPPQSPGSLLYVLYVLYGSTPSRGTSTLPRVLAICTICAILFCTRFKMYYMCYTMHIWYMLEMLCV